jgi:hypothetical protein
VVLTVVPCFAPQLEVTATSSQSSFCCQCSLKSTTRFQRREKQNEEKNDPDRPTTWVGGEKDELSDKIIK